MAEVTPWLTPMAEAAATATASLAPMVRLGTLPLRLLSLERGAALVYSEELVDAKIATSTRSVDARLGTTDWRGPAGQIVFRTCEAERGRLVVQLGTADPEGALAAARKLFDPADPTRDGIVQLDVNMGCPTLRWCPKECSSAGGSGAALFADRERAERVVAALRAFLPAGVLLSCKIRLCAEGPEATLERCRGLIAAGAAALAIHARCATDRPNDAARWAELAPVIAGLAGQARLTVNGDALDSVSAEELRRATGCASVLVARGALLSPSPFVPPGGHAPPPTPRCDASCCVCPGCEAEVAAREGLCACTRRLCRRYAQLAMASENNPLNTGFVLLWPLGTARGGPATAPLRSAPGSSGQRDTARRGGPATGRPAVAPGASSQPLPTSPICHCPWPPRLLHARLRERAAERPPPAGDPHGLAAAAAALRDATSLEDVVGAVGMGDEWRAAAAARGTPAIASHRYRADYFDDLAQRTDWAAALPRAAIAARRALARGASCSNADIRTALLGAPPAGAKRKKQEPDRCAELRERAAARGLFARVFVTEQRPPEERVLGYYAAAWRCRAVLGGKPHDGRFKKSVRHAQQDAAMVALEALEALPPSVAVVVPLAPSARQEVPTEAPRSEETRVEEQPPAKRVRRPMALVPRSVKVARPR